MKSEQHNQPTDNEVIKNLENIILQLRVELDNKNDKLKNLEVALSQSNEKFINLFDRSIVGKSITTLDGKIHVNKAFSEILGYSENELRDLNWKEITYHDDIETNSSIFKKILSGEKDSERWEKRYIHKDGHIVWVDVSTSLQYDKNGAPWYFITVINEISEQKIAEKALKESEYKFRKIFEVSPDGITLTKVENGEFISINPSYTQIFGYTEDEIVGKKSIELNLWVDVNDRKIWDDMLMSNGEVKNFESKFRTKSGKIVDCLVSASKIELNGEECILSQTRDITERKKQNMHSETAKKNSERYFISVPNR